MFFYSQTVNQITGSEPANIPITDPYFSNVSLLLKGEMLGTNNDGSNYFIDSSANAMKAFIAGSVTKSSVIFKYGNHSMQFDGNGGYLATYPTYNYNFESVNFTVEMWLNPGSGLANGTQSQLFGNRASMSLYRSIASFLTYDTSQHRYRLSFVASMSNSTWKVAYTTPTTVIYPNVWTHVAFVRNGDEFSVFINGIKTVMSIASGAITTGYNNWTIGSNSEVDPRYSGLTHIPPQISYWGCMDDFRITKGTARYTSNFTPGPI